MRTLIGLRNALIPSVVAWGLIFGGCAGVQKAIQTGNETLAIIDSFYDKVVDQKLIPNTLQAATVILQQADVIASQAKVGKDTATTQAQARVLAAQAGSL